MVETVFDPREFESPLDTKDLTAMFKSLSFNRSFVRFNMKKTRLDRESAIAAAEVFTHNSEIRMLSVTDCAPHTSHMMAVSSALALRVILVRVCVAYTNVCVA